MDLPLLFEFVRIPDFWLCFFCYLWIHLLISLPLSKYIPGNTLRDYGLRAGEDGNIFELNRGDELPKAGEDEFIKLFTKNTGKKGSGTIFLARHCHEW